MSLRTLAAAADVDPGYLSQVFSGRRQPSVPVLAALTKALGADLAIRAYPTTGPNIHDKFQMAIVEELLRIAAPSWSRAVEVTVVRPARGFIDVVLSRPTDVVATEVESRIDRLEQQVRWAQDKAASLPSADLWQDLHGDPAIHRLLVLRSTAATREMAFRFELVLQTAYPAGAAELHAALTSDGLPWPGSGILWTDVIGDDVRIRDRPPRGINVGR